MRRNRSRVGDEDARMNECVWAALGLGKARYLVRKLRAHCRS